MDCHSIQGEVAIYAQASVCCTQLISWLNLATIVTCVLYFRNLRLSLGNFEIKDITSEFATELFWLLVLITCNILLK